MFRVSEAAETLADGAHIDGVVSTNLFWPDAKQRTQDELEIGIVQRSQFLGAELIVRKDNAIHGCRAQNPWP